MSSALPWIDKDTGTIVATALIGSGVDGAAYDAASADVFASNADGTLTVIHPGRSGSDKPLLTDSFSVLVIER